MRLLSYMIIYLCEHKYVNTIEFFHPKNKHFLKKTAHAGQNFIRKYSYLKIKFHLCIRKIISKLLSMQEPTNITTFMDQSSAPMVISAACEVPVSSSQPLDKSTRGPRLSLPKDTGSSMNDPLLDVSSSFAMVFSYFAALYSCC